MLRAYYYTIEGDGFGCVLQVKALDNDTRTFLNSMEAMTKQPLSSFSAVWTPLKQLMESYSTTAISKAAPEGMVRIPPNSKFHFVVNGVEIEHKTPGNGVGVDVQFPWESIPFRRHDHVLSIQEFYIDKTPVTNAAYRQYLETSGYQPADAHNFLKNWFHNGTYQVPAGSEEHPVTYVSLAEATSYCKYYNKRLPNSWEWQYAAQGTDGRLYPWGDTYDAARCPPLYTDNNTLPGPSSVHAYPNGESPFGVRDLVGNVWQYTNQFYDKHTRAVVVRGGSNYYPSVSKGAFNWYFSNSLIMRKLTTHGKYFLMSDSYERAGTIGFRCVTDAGT